MTGSPGMHSSERELTPERILARLDSLGSCLDAMELDLETTGFADVLVFARLQALAGFEHVVEQIVLCSGLGQIQRRSARHVLLGLRVQEICDGIFEFGWKFCKDFLHERSTSIRRCNLERLQSQSNRSGGDTLNTPQLQTRTIQDY